MPVMSTTDCQVSNMPSTLSPRRSTRRKSVYPFEQLAKQHMEAENRYGWTLTHGTLVEWLALLGTCQSLGFSCCAVPRGKVLLSLAGIPSLLPTGPKPKCKYQTPMNWSEFLGDRLRLELFSTALVNGETGQPLRWLLAVGRALATPYGPYCAVRRCILYYLAAALEI